MSETAGLTGFCKWAAQAWLLPRRTLAGEYRSTSAILVQLSAGDRPGKAALTLVIGLDMRISASALDHLPCCACCCIICCICCSDWDDISPKRMPTRAACFKNFSQHLVTHCRAQQAPCHAVFTQHQPRRTTAQLEDAAGDRKAAYEMVAAKALFPQKTQQMCTGIFQSTASTLQMHAS